MTLKDSEQTVIQQAETKLGLSFSDKHLLLEALTHSSFYKKQERENKGQGRDNERLEFLGDAVLKLVGSHYLFEAYPTQSEGDLTKMRAQLISDRSCATFGKFLGLGQLLRFSYGEKRSGGAEKSSNVGNAFEALLGAIYLDKGFEASKTFLLHTWEASSFSIEALTSSSDFKSQLQEILQKHKEALPIYDVVDEHGPEHEKHFEVKGFIRVKGKSYTGIGTGPTKKEAEQQAAKDLVQALKQSNIYR